MKKLKSFEVYEAILYKGILVNSLENFVELPTEYKYSKKFILDVLEAHSETKDINAVIDFYNKLISKLKDDKDIIKIVAEILCKNNFLEKKYYNISADLKREYLAFSVMQKYKAIDGLEKNVKLLLKDIGNMTSIPNDILLNELFWLTVIKNCNRDMFEEISATIPTEILNNHQFIVDVGYIRGEILPVLVDMIDYNSDKEVMLGAISSYPENFKLLATDLDSDVDILKALAFLDINNLRSEISKLRKNEELLLAFIDYTEGNIFAIFRNFEISSKKIAISLAQYGYFDIRCIPENFYEDENFVKSIIDTDPFAFSELPENIQRKKKYFLYACSVHGHKLIVDDDTIYYSFTDKEFTRKILEYGYFLTDYEFPDWVLKDRALLLKALTACAYAYELLPEKIKCDAELTLEIVKAYMNNEEYSKEYNEKNRFFGRIPEKLKLDKNVLLELVKNGMPAQQIPSSMRDDEDIMIEALKYDIAENRFFDMSKLKSNVDKMLDLLGETQGTLELINWDNVSLTDEQIGRIQKVVRTSPSALLYLPDNFPTYKKMCKEAFKLDPYFIARGYLSSDDKIAHIRLSDKYKTITEKAGIKEDELLKLTNTNIVLNLKNSYI